MLIEVYLTFASTVAAILVVTEFLKNLINTSGFTTQLVSWGTGVVIVMFGFFAQLGWLAEVELWWHAAIWALGAALASNGLFEVPIVKAFLSSLFAFIGKK